MIHKLCDPDAPNSSVNVGNAVYRIELSRVINSSPAATVTSRPHRCRLLKLTSSHLSGTELSPPVTIPYVRYSYDW
jgi:hypothetical protein